MLFGLVRGLAVFLGRGITSPAALADFHRRFIAFGPLARAGAVACELAVGVALAAARFPWAAVALIAVVALGRRPGGAAATPAPAQVAHITGPERRRIDVRSESDRSWEGRDRTFFFTGWFESKERPWSPSRERHSNSRLGRHRHALPAFRSNVPPCPSRHPPALPPPPLPSAHRPTPTHHPRGQSPPIRLFLADVDGTLVTQDKVLTDDAVAAVHRLRDAGVLFAITSGRPPRGMEMLIEPLALDTPIAAFNGGLVVDARCRCSSSTPCPRTWCSPVADLMTLFDLDVWLYRGADWYVPDPKGPHVDREAWTVKFDPKVMQSLDGLTEGVVKLVGVSDDHDAIERASDAAAEQFGDHVTAAASQPYYLDVTHPDANKGSVALYLAKRYRLSPRPRSPPSVTCPTTS